MRANAEVRVASKSTKPQTRDDLVIHAREMRHEPTDAERELWINLRNRRLAGFKFRRQHPIGPYILDFFCEAAQLAVELDGGQHDEDAARKYDETRTRYLESHGIRVLRVWDCDALKDTDAVVRTILRELEHPVARPHPNPLPVGEGINAGGERVFLALPNPRASSLPLPPGEGRGEGERRSPRPRGEQK